MNKSVKLIALGLSLFVAVLVAFSAGYYRGYHRASRISCAFDLGDIRAFLETGILDNSRFFRQMDVAPFHTFMFELSHSNAGDTTKSLQEADELIARDNLTAKMKWFHGPVTKTPH